MATTVVKTIGTTARDYSTIQSWEDACPANLVTDDKIWRGECYNDSEFTAGVTIAGMTTDVTRYVELTVAAGQSFQDHADVRTNPLRYDQTKGVGVSISTAYVTVVSMTAEYLKISRLQIRHTASNDGTCIQRGGTQLAATIADCVCSSANSSASYGAPVEINATKLLNCVIVQLHTSGPGLLVYAGSAVIGCTIIKPTDITAAATGIRAPYPEGLIIQSNNVFGFTTAASAGTYHASCGYNATNLASGLPGTTGNVYNVTYNQTTPFTDADKDSLDLRAIAATALAGAGYRDSTNAPNDISGTARTATPTIGAWELAAAAAGYVFSELPRGIARGVQRGMMRMIG